MPKVRVQSQICYPLSMPTYTVNVFNEIVPEMSVEVQYSTTVAKWMHVLLDWRRGRVVTSYARSALLVWLLGFHRPLNFTHKCPVMPSWQGWVFSSAQPPTLMVSKLVFTLGLFAVICRSNLALCRSVKMIYYAVKKKKKKNLTMAVGLPQDHPSRASPQDVMTWQWLALWHRPSNTH